MRFLRLMPGKGEVVLAEGDPELSEDELRSFAAERMAHFKVPRHVRIKDELPMTVTGKAQKFLMRKAMMEELGLSETRTA